MGREGFEPSTLGLRVDAGHLLSARECWPRHVVGPNWFGFSWVFWRRLVDLLLTHRVARLDNADRLETFPGMRHAADAVSASPSAAVAGMASAIGAHLRHRWTQVFVESARRRGGLEVFREGLGRGQDWSHPSIESPQRQAWQSAFTTSSGGRRSSSRSSI